MNSSFNSNLIEQAIDLHKKGEIVKAEELYLNILKKDKNNYEVLNLLAVINLQLNKIDQAVKLVDESINIEKNYPPSRNNRGVILKKLQRFDEAKEEFLNCLKIDPHYIDALANLTSLLTFQKNFKEALRFLNKLILLKSDISQYYLNRGSIYKMLNSIEESIEDFKKAIYLDKDNYHAHYNLGCVFFEKKNFLDSINSFNLAIAISPNHMPSYCNLSLALAKVNRYEEALNAVNQAISLDSGHFYNYLNKAYILSNLGEYKEALSLYEKVVEIEPNSADGHFGKACLLLKEGNFKDGFTEYEWRDKIDNIKKYRDYIKPPLRKGDLFSKKKIFVYYEQGFGDTIHFSRYLNELSNLDAKVFFQPQKELVDLFKSSNFKIDVIEEPLNPEQFDHHLPLLSLPYILNAKIDNIPCKNKYLHANKQKIEELSNLLGKKEKKRIGIAWSGRANHPNDRNRSIKLEKLISLLPDKFEYFCIQKDLKDGEINLLSKNNVRYLNNHMNSFSGTAAICELMDLIITVDTSLAHLAGALEKNTWILVPFHCDFRWFLDKTFTPWYNSAKLYRQKKIDDWDSVLIQLKNDLTFLN